jgi:hypothetical protein
MWRQNRPMAFILLYALSMYPPATQSEINEFSWTMGYINITMPGLTPSNCESIDLWEFNDLQLTTAWRDAAVTTYDSFDQLFLEYVTPEQYSAEDLSRRELEGSPLANDTIRTTSSTPRYDTDPDGGFEWTPLLIAQYAVYNFPDRDILTDDEIAEISSIKFVSVMDFGDAAVDDTVGRAVLAQYTLKPEVAPISQPVVPPITPPITQHGTNSGKVKPPKKRAPPQKPLVNKPILKTLSEIPDIQLSTSRALKTLSEISKLSEIQLSSSQASKTEQLSEKSVITSETPGIIDVRNVNVYDSDLDIVDRYYPDLELVHRFVFIYLKIHNLTFVETSFFTTENYDSILQESRKLELDLYAEINATSATPTGSENRRYNTNTPCAAAWIDVILQQSLKEVQNNISIPNGFFENDMVINKLSPQLEIVSASIDTAVANIPHTVAPSQTRRSLSQSTAFLLTPGLSELYLRGNNIERVPVDFFSNMTSISMLDFGENQIPSVLIEAPYCIPVPCTGIACGQPTTPVPCTGLACEATYAPDET